MTDLMGSPGTWSGLALRLAQCVCSEASIHAFILSSHSGASFLAYQFLMASLICLLVGSLVHAFYDIYCLTTKRAPELWIIRWIVFLDWYVAILTFASASASAGLAIFMERDFPFCKMYPELSCDRYVLFIVLAFMAWSFAAASAASSFCLLASFF